jgi:uncharacterized protein YndB with AHSA1/START domain
MKRSKKKIEIRLERRIPAAPGEVCEAWLNREVPGTPWNEGDKLILTTEVDGLFYWLVEGTPHYGRFTEIKKPNRIQHTWMSPYTFGEESTVTVTFKKAGEDTLMTLVHAGLPDSDEGRAHEKGWNYFLDNFPKQFGAGAPKKK